MEIPPIWEKSWWWKILCNNNKYISTHFYIMLAIWTKLNTVACFDSKLRTQSYKRFSMAIVKKVCSSRNFFHNSLACCLNINKTLGITNLDGKKIRSIWSVSLKVVFTEQQCCVIVQSISVGTFGGLSSQRFVIAVDAVATYCKYRTVVNAIMIVERSFRCGYCITKHSFFCCCSSAKSCFYTLLTA